MPDTKQRARLTKARSRLLLDAPWFGSLSLRLRIQENPDAPTMQTDGTSLEYNPAWTAGITDAELMGVVAHEVMHCALLHPFRMTGRDAKKWNIACDLAINPLLVAQGIKLPASALIDLQYAGMAAEQIYARLPAGDPNAPGGAGMGDVVAPDPNAKPKPGESGSGKPMTETDWQIASEQATMVARKAGKMDGGTERAARMARESRTDWRVILRRFIEQTVPSDYSWTRPNRRYIARGIYLPGIVCENMPRLGIAVDTSGSVDQELLSAFGAELTAIMHEANPAALDVVYCDTRVQHTETFTPDDGAVILHAHGGGGTEFQPALDWFTQSDEPVAAVIYLTDLYGSAPIEPGYPVLWAVPMGSRKQAPFGELIRI